jgi:hypothetical protein
MCRFAWCPVRRDDDSQVSPCFFPEFGGGHFFQGGSISSRVPSAGAIHPPWICRGNLGGGIFSRGVNFQPRGENCPLFKAEAGSRLLLERLRAEHGPDIPRRCR